MTNFDFFQKPSSKNPNRNRVELSLTFVFIVFLLSFVVSCTFLFTRGFHNWGFSPECKVTIGIPIGTPSAGMSLEQFSALHAKKVHDVTERIKQTHEFVKVEPVAPHKIRSIVEAWTGEINSTFQFPTLLDVSFQSTTKVNFESLIQDLRNISSDITLENHNTWSQKLSVFGHSLEIVSISIGGLILLCLIVIVTLITKASLQAYYSTLGILRLMGAKDSYIANIFQSHIMKTALKGGIIGFCLSIPIVYILVFAVQHLGLNGMAWNSVFLYILAILISIPLIVMFLSMIVSRITVLSQLRKLDVLP